MPSNNTIRHWNQKIQSTVSVNDFRLNAFRNCICSRVPPAPMLKSGLVLVSHAIRIGYTF